MKIIERFRELFDGRNFVMEYGFFKVVVILGEFGGWISYRKELLFVFNFRVIFSSCGGELVCIFLKEM